MSALIRLLQADNEVFAMARHGKRLPNIPMAILALLVIMIGGFVPLSIAAESIYGNVEALEKMWGGAFFLIGPFLMMIGCLGLWVRFFEGRPFSTAGFKSRRPVKSYLTGFALGFLMLAVIIGMMALTGVAELDRSGAQTDGVSLALGLLLMLVGFIIQGGGEEILMRGWLFQVLGARYTPWVGFTVSTVLFTAFHGSTSIMANINLLLFSVFLAFYYLYEGSLWGAMGWHSAWNWAQANIFGVRLSGSMESEQTLMNVRTTGSPLLSGGDYGPEGSVFCTFLFLVGLLVLAHLAKRKTGAVSSSLMSSD